MPVECDEFNGVSVITVRGDLAADEAAAVRAVLSARASRPNIVVDLEACRFLTSVGLEALLEALRTCENRGGRVMLAGPDDNCRKILELARLDHRFECHRGLAAALKAQ